MGTGEGWRALELNEMKEDEGEDEGIRRTEGEKDGDARMGTGVEWRALEQNEMREDEGEDEERIEKKDRVGMECKIAIGRRHMEERK